MAAIFFNAPFLIGVAMAATGLTVMAGWLFRLRPLLELVPGYQMVFATGGGFALGGVALACTLLAPERRARIQTALGAAIALLGAAALAQYALGWNLGLDMHRMHAWMQTTNAHPGRPAIATAGAFVLVGSAFIALGRSEAIVRALSGCAALIGLAALAGNALGLGAVFPAYPLAEVSLSTAGGFALLGFALWLALPRFEGHRPLWHGEAARIKATGAAVVLVIGAVSAVGGFAVMQARTEAVLEAWLAESLANRVSLVREEAAERLRAAELLAGLQVVRQQMRAAVAPETRSRALGELDLIGASILRGNVVAVRFVAPDGSELVRAGAGREPSAMRTPVPGRPGTFLSWKGRFELESRADVIEAGETLGALELRMPLRQMAWTDIWQDLQLRFCAAADRALSCFPARGSPQASVRPLAEATPQMARALAGGTGVLRGRDPGGRDVIAAYAPLAELGLGVVANVQARELFAPLRAPLAWLVLLIAALCVGAVALLFRSVVPLVRRLSRSEEKLRLALSGSRLALFEADVRTGSVTLSEQWTVMRGGPAGPEATNVAALKELLHPEEAPGIIEHSRKALRGEISHYDIEHRVRKLDGSWMWIRSRGEVADRDRNGHALRIIGTNAVITERKHRELIAMQAAAHDKLTGLPNRRLFDDRLKHALARAHRTRMPLAVLYVDADRFKQVNDTHGHSAGDALLKSFGARLAACVRATDTVARIGGDEFAVILESVEIERDAHAVAQKIVAALREPFEIEGHRVEVSASVGVAILCDRDGFLAEALLKRADRALYDAKGAGKDRYALAA
ncbi:MAG TPA: diguanylate cyclase [Burkholderiales bacterium]|nr:diguanylate cyclase [Burkholderiales bacterium]